MERPFWLVRFRRCLCSSLITFGVISFSASSGPAQAQLAPLLQKGASPVDWWFVFKFNTKAFPGCVPTTKRACLFGGDLQDYPKGFGLQSISASSANPKLHNDNGCLGESTDDPIGATFDEIYNGATAM